MTKRFIAKDTGEPLTVLGGYDIVEGGGIVRKYVTESNTEPKVNKEDLELLNELGIEGLKERQLFGVLDRLVRAGIIEG